MAEYTIGRFIHILAYKIGYFILMCFYINRFIRRISLNKKLILKILISITILLTVDYLGFLIGNLNIITLYILLYSLFDIMVFTVTLLGTSNIMLNFSKVLFIKCILLVIEVISIIFLFEILKQPDSTTSLILLSIIITAIGLLLYYLLRNVDLKIIFNDIFEIRYVKIIFVLSYLINYYFFIYNSSKNSNVYLLTSSIYLIIIFMMFIYNYYIKNKELKETIILQQEEYIKSLESMQEDIRKYNHDYKNLLTGALLQAEEGDYEGVQNYLQDVLDEFELKLGKQISKNTQLKKINSNELKGLLLSKISEMEDKNIEFHLEVLNEVSKINMKSTDLVRCLGILLDNAIEEVIKLDEKIISLVILQEENITTIMVKNPVTEKVNIQSIYEDNFSTKGEKRGLGLSNYREIIENYENIVRETICTEEEFNQVLKIG